MLALALVLDGSSRADAARACGMDRQTLRDWVHRYNADGLAGLSDRHGGGTPCLLSAEQEHVIRLDRQGPGANAGWGNALATAWCMDRLVGAEKLGRAEDRLLS